MTCSGCHTPPRNIVRVTGDEAILDEMAPFLDGRVLAEGEPEAYFVPTIGSESACTLFDHCRRAIARGLTSGPHGLPLIGTGDWNDGMNLVGREGRGESVWLAWFLCENLRLFADLAAAHGDDEFRRLCTRK